MSNLSAASKTLPSTPATSTQLARLDRKLLFSIVLVVAAFVYFQTDFRRYPVSGDSANWDYFAQVIARGGVPYRDVVNIKTPLSAYISAVALLILRPLGLSDVIAIRLVYILLAALTVALTFFVAHHYFRSRRIALLAAAIMLSFDLFATSNSSGTQPKTPMIVLGLMALWAVKVNRPFWAGLFGMLSMLSWQPGLLFAGVAGLAFSRHLTGWRDGKALRVIAGAALPLAILALYFWATGALRDFYLWCFHYNYTVYAPIGIRSSSNLSEKLSRLIHIRYSSETVYFYTAAIGMLIALVGEGLRAKADGIKSLIDRAPHHAILIAPLVYFTFCLINIQGPPDIFPLLPFVSIYAALALVFALDRVIWALGRLSPGRRFDGFRMVSYILLVGLVCYWSVADIFLLKVEELTLQDQEKAVAEMVSYLRPGDKIFVHGDTHLLVLSQRPNLSKYFFLDRGKDMYLDEIEPDGFNGWIERIRSERPRVIGLSRLQTVEKAAYLESLVKVGYLKAGSKGIGYYLRMP